MTQEFTDYSTILMDIENLERKIHDACLDKKFDVASDLTNKLFDRVIDLKIWIKTQ